MPKKGCNDKCETRKRITAARKDDKPYEKNGKKCGRGYNGKGNVCYRKVTTASGSTYLLDRNRNFISPPRRQRKKKS